MLQEHPLACSNSSRITWWTIPRLHFTRSSIVALWPKGNSVRRLDVAHGVNLPLRARRLATGVWLVADYSRFPRYNPATRFWQPVHPVLTALILSCPCIWASSRRPSTQFPSATIEVRQLPCTWAGETSQSTRHVFLESRIGNDRFVFARLTRYSYSADLRIATFSSKREPWFTRRENGEDTDVSRS